jgi:cytochrome c-type biogenesis protein CcmH
MNDASIPAAHFLRGFASICAAGICVISPFALAQAEQAKSIARYESLAHELRCLVCQNQSLADSNADLAQDLKREVKTLIAQEKSDIEIKNYLQARYGDFVLYSPPVQSNTFFLWGGPFAALALGAGVALFMVRKRQRINRESGASLLSEDERAELEERLK